MTVVAVVARALECTATLADARAVCHHCLATRYTIVHNEINKHHARHHQSVVQCWTGLHPYQSDSCVEHCLALVCWGAVDTLRAHCVPAQGLAAQLGRWR